MRVFISWSGERSKHVALALRDWLPDVLQSVEPWLSAQDVESGARWAQELERTLAESEAGIVCLTRENLDSQWLHFEAGSLAKLGKLVCPYLLDISPAELRGPLAQFQCTYADHGGTYRLVTALNQLGAHPLSSERINRVFSVHWPRLNDALESIPAAILEDEPKDGRTLEAKIDELLELTRSIARRTEGIGDIRDSGPPVGRTTSDPAESKKPRIFIASSTEGLQIAELVQLGLEHVAETTIWTQSTFDLTRTPIESIVDVAAEFDFAVVVLTADDMLEKRGEEKPVPRDNLLFELGLFTGGLGRARTFMVYCREDDLHLPSDLVGVTAATYSRREDGNLEAALGPVCTRIKRAMGAAQ